MGPKFFLFLSVLLFQLVFASGHLYSYDEVVIEETAANLWDHGDAALSVTPEKLLYAKIGRDGSLYSKFGFGMSAALVPFYAAGKFLGGMMLGGRGDLALTQFAHFFTSFANAVLIAVIAVVFYSTLLLLGVRPRPALLTTLMLSMTTTLAVYGRGLFNDPLTGLALLLSFQMILLDRPALAGAASAASFFTRAEYILIVPALAIFVGQGAGHSRWNKSYRWKELLRFCAPIAVLGLLLGLFNWTRFGSPFDQGTLHHDPLDVFDTPIPLGLYGLFLSPGKGLLWYSPPIVLAALGARTMARRNLREGLLILALSLPVIILHAHFHSWMGGWSYGPRRLMALLPLLMLPAGAKIEQLLESFRGKTIIAVTCTFGFLMQLGGLTTNFMTYIGQAHESTLWSIHGSSAVGQVRDLLMTGHIDIWYVTMFGRVLPLISASIVVLLIAFCILSARRAWICSPHDN